jgi:hypothetical protein
VLGLEKKKEKHKAQGKGEILMGAFWFGDRDT